MPESKNNAKKDILENLDPYLKKRYESELQHIFEHLEEENELAEAAEEICAETNNINEIQAKLVILIREHLKKHKKGKKKEGKNVNADAEKLEKNLAKICQEIMQQQERDQDIDPRSAKMSGIARDKLLTEKSKQNLKRILRGFMIYEMYKVMNPRRIAGETKKDNYQHNLILRGAEKAKLYEGGRPADLKKYTTKEIGNMHMRASNVRKNINKNKGRAR